MTGKTVGNTFLYILSVFSLHCLNVYKWFKRDYFLRRNAVLGSQKFPNNYDWCSNTGICFCHKSLYCFPKYCISLTVVLKSLSKFLSSQFLLTAEIFQNHFGKEFLPYQITASLLILGYSLFWTIKWQSLLAISVTFSIFGSILEVNGPSSLNHCNILSVPEHISPML